MNSINYISRLHWKIIRSENYQNLKMFLADKLYAFRLISGDKLTNIYADACAKKIIREMSREFIENFSGKLTR